MKSRAMTFSRSLQCRAFSWAVMDEKLLSLLVPICSGGGVWRGAGGGGAVAGVQLTGA